MGGRARLGNDRAGGEITGQDATKRAGLLELADHNREIIVRRYLIRENRAGGCFVNPPILISASKSPP